ncbi:phage holin family protein, partial [Patescibacteria group bacterium]|nr:phage holin family protein [Patescibacteria group bacterium]
MKKILKRILILSFTLIATNYIWRNLRFNDSLTTILLVSLILSIFESIIKPIVKILLLPITILTLGSIRILINTLGMYLAVF